MDESRLAEQSVSHGHRDFNRGTRRRRNSIQRSALWVSEALAQAGMGDRLDRSGVYARPLSIDFYVATPWCRARLGLRAPKIRRLGTSDVHTLAEQLPGSLGSGHEFVGRSLT